MVWAAVPPAAGAAAPADLAGSAGPPDRPTDLIGPAAGLTGLAGSAAQNSAHTPTPAETPAVPGVP